MVIDFHVCPSIDLSIIKDRLSSVGVSKVVLQPIDALPLFHILPNNYNLLKELVSEDEYGALLWSKFVIKLTSMWSSAMYDNMKLWYEATNHDRNFFIPFASINPALGIKYVAEKLNELSSLDVRGLVVSPTLQLFNPLETKAFRSILEYVEGKNMLLVMHLDPCPYSVSTCFKGLMPSALIDILERYSINLVLSALGISESMAYPWLESVSRLVRRYDRIYVETSGISCILFNTQMGKRFLKSIGAERILFGGGYPYLRLRQVIKGISCVERSGLPRHDIEAVLHDNAAYLLRIIGLSEGSNDEDITNMKKTTVAF